MKRFLSAAVVLTLFLLVSGPTLLQAAPPAGGGAAPQIVERFPIFKNGDALLASVSLKEGQFPFLVDTGASGTVIDSLILKGAPKQTVPVATPNGAIMVKRYEMPAATLGRLSFHPADLIMGIDLSKQREVSGHELFGVIGMDFLRNYVMQIDFEKGELILMKSLEGKPGTAIPLGYVMGGVPQVSFQVNKNTETFIVDTGAVGVSTGCLRAPLFKSLEKSGALKVIGKASAETGNGTMEMSVGRLKSFTLAGFTVERPVFTDAASFSLLSLGFLSRFQVTFDFPNNTLYLKEGKSFKRLDKLDHSGVKLIRRNGKTVVFSVNKGSSGDQAGIKIGDIITDLDGIKASQKTLFELRDLFSDEGLTVALTVQRGAQSLQVPLTLVKG
jgi:hypothetical protein